MADDHVVYGRVSDRTADALIRAWRAIADADALDDLRMLIDACAAICAHSHHDDLAHLYRMDAASVREKPIQDECASLRNRWDIRLSVVFNQAQLARWAAQAPSTRSWTADHDAHEPVRSVAATARMS